MAGGQKINDHSFWAGGMSKESPLPTQTKVKYESSAEGAGGLSNYEDTTETIKSQQMKSISKAKGRPLAPGYRN